MGEEIVFSIDQIDGTSWRIMDKAARMFLFEGTEKALLIDTGFGSGDLRKMISGLTKLPVMLVNTHSDHDHVGGNKQFERAFMHPSEFALYHRAVGEELAVSPLWEGDVIDLGNRKFEVIFIPGHTPGSIALLDAQNRVLVGGDSILDDVIAMSEYWRDFDAYICSMEKLNKMRERFDMVYTSHATFPLSPDIIEGIIAGAIRCKNGEVDGMDTDAIRNGPKSAEEKDRLIALLEGLQASKKDMMLFDVGVATFAV